MRKIYDYDLVKVATMEKSEDVLNNLVLEVQKACNEGWRPHGNMVSWGGWLIQPLIRTETTNL